ncbi:MAG: hypothetical protein R2824_04170 [Saprospiraceae bacterium]|nr:hypothetical protein [Lewinella sp.]
MLKLLTSLCCFVLLSQLQAQTLHIHYNVQTQEITYVLDGNKLTRPVIRHNGEVVFHLENFNNFLYQVEIDRKEDLSAASAGSAGLNSIGGILSMGALPTLNGAGGGELDDLFGVADNALDNFDDFEDDRGLVETVEGQQLTVLRQRMEKVLTDMADVEEEISKLNRNIQTHIDKQRFVDLAQQEIKRIKYHPGLKPGQIRELSTEFIGKALGTSDLRQLSGNMLDEADKRAQTLKQEFNQLKAAQQDYALQVNRLEGIQTSMSTLGVSPDNSTYKELESIMFDVLTRVVELQDNMAENREKINATLEQGPDQYLRNLIDLRYEIESLRENDFSYTQRFPATGGEFVLQPKLTPVDTNGMRTSGETKILAPVKVGVRGGLRITNSLGLSIGQYFTAPQEYQVRNGTIIATDKDSFIPILNTFFHFHPHSAGKASLGGSLGIGLPLAGASATQSATFLLGPSLILGEKDLVVLSTGLLGGQVERLKGGWQNGDNFSAQDGLLPTTRLYELGYFFSLSFKIFGK